MKQWRAACYGCNWFGEWFVQPAAAIEHLTIHNQEHHPMPPQAYEEREYELTQKSKKSRKSKQKGVPSQHESNEPNESKPAKATLTKKAQPKTNGSTDGPKILPDA